MPVLPYMGLHTGHTSLEKPYANLHICYHVGAGIGKIAYANWYGYKTDKDIVKEERLER